MQRAAGNALVRMGRRCACALTLTIAAAAPSGLRAQSIQIPHQPKPLLVGYFPQWGVYNEQKYLVKNLIAHSPGKKPTLLVDQLNYAQGFVTNGRCSVADSNADLNLSFTAAESVDGRADSPTQRFRGNLHQLALLKKRFPRLRILISLEGRASDFAFDAQPENRAAFVRSCVDTFLRGNLAPGIREPHLFDGIDVDWEYPHDTDASNFDALLRELRRQMDAVRPGLTLSIATGHSPHMYDGIDMGAIAKLVDQVGLMMYDFTGPWNQRTGFLAPLSAPDDYKGGTIERSVNAYLDAGVDPSKILIGVPFYGYGWSKVPDEQNGLFQEGVSIHGDRPYSYIEGLVAQSTVHRDQSSGAPWLFDGDSFWTYDDEISIERKAAFARERNLGGLMIWELGEDDSGSTLLRAAHNAIAGRAVSRAQQDAPAPVASSTENSVSRVQ